MPFFRPNAPISRTSRRLGEAWVWLLFLLALGCACAAYWMLGQAKTEAAFKFNEELSDPATLLNRFFIELGRPEHPMGEDSWRKLWAMTSREDQAWIEANMDLLASYKPGGGYAAPNPDADVRHHDALCYLLDSQFGKDRPVLVQQAIAPSGDFAVTYVHPPGHIEQLHEVFMAREGGQWRIRRVMGARDDAKILGLLLADKLDKKLPLSPDEQAFQKAPKAYAVKTRARLLTESGLDPKSVPPAVGN